MFLRPLSHSASALVFFSRRTDQPYRYTTSLGKLNFTANAVYEVSRESTAGPILVPLPGSPLVSAEWASQPPSSIMMPLDSESPSYYLPLNVGFVLPPQPHTTRSTVRSQALKPTYVHPLGLGLIPPPTQSCHGFGCALNTAVLNLGKWGLPVVGEEKHLQSSCLSSLHAGAVGVATVPNH